MFLFVLKAKGEGSPTAAPGPGQSTHRWTKP